MKCENGCGRENTKYSKPVRRYYDDQGGKGAFADFCTECALALHVINEKEALK